MKKIIKSATLLSAFTASLLCANSIESVENAVVQNSGGKYAITGYFAQYDFDNNGKIDKSDWTFTFAKAPGTYQLLGDLENGIGVFKWKKVNVTPNEPSFYMVNYDPNDTKFGWILFQKDTNNNCTAVYKLAGQNPDTKAFSYDVDGDGKADKLTNLTCKVNGESVTFTKVNNKTTSSSASAPTDVTKAEVLSGDITSNKTLTKDKLWKIDGLVKVKPGATLTIEPGTTIFGDNIGDDYIVVMKGAKIIADGTTSEPIIFTSEAALKDPASAAPGQWGGLTILGGAPTNHDNPRYEVDENDPDFAFGAAKAGEGDANDNSGIIRNVYLLNSGKTIGTDLEINGLSLAGVGAGTVVENVTVKNSSDDCIEIWGGTVNVKNAYLENCQDDSFDLDYGYVGHAKGIIVKQVEPAHAGFEISSGGDNPMTKPVIENFVIEKVAYSDEGGIYIKDDTTAPTFINGTVKVDSSDVAIHTKKPATQAQLDTIAFKNVTLSPETFDGKAGNDIKTRLEANKAN